MRIINCYENLNQAIAGVFGEGTFVRERNPVSGGDINRAYALMLSNGERIFMKDNSIAKRGFFIAESDGLSAIKKTRTIQTPEVLALGTDGDRAFLFLEYIKEGRGGRASSEELGRGLAKMHLADTESFVKGGDFGFLSDNFIGASVQVNTPKSSWIEFFSRCRLWPQIQMAAGYFDTDDMKKIERLLQKLDQYLVEPAKPSLLHGDLWAGNYMIDQEGRPWLIDPAVYVGHAEADLAMTELFGGFDRAFYEAYKEVVGIDPSYKERRDLYNLYHLLNHLNLFGGGYFSSVRSIIDRYV